MTSSTYRSWLWFVHDVLLWGFCLLASMHLRFNRLIPPVEWEYFWRFLPLSGAAILFGFLWRGVYRQELSDRWAWRELWWGWLTGTGISLAILFVLKIPFSRSVFGLSAITFLAGTIIDRVLVRELSRIFGEKPARHLMGIGFRESQRRSLVSRLSDCEDISWTMPDDLDPSFEDISEADPDVILVRFDRCDFDFVRSLFDFGSRYQIPVRIFPTSDNLFLSRTSSESWQGLRLLRSNLHHRFQQQLAIKTIVDYFLTVILASLTMPVFLLTGLFIMVVDGRPVFYSHKRVGRGGELFDMYKFRTMCPDASDKGPELTEGPDDPRITTIGRFLRRWSLDELPQLINILKGEMSLVGPRPEVPTITEDYSPRQRRVLWLKPGLTGLSQVSGREQLELDRKLEIDQIYLNDYSIGMDLWILLKTFYVVLRGEGTN